MTKQRKRQRREAPRAKIAAAPAADGWALSPDNARRARWGAIVAILVATFGMFRWSWGTWPDPVVDFGRELYVPWRLNEGDVLYRDIAYFNGPLSPYLNAIWFRAFGTSLRVLALANFGFVLLLLALVHSLAAQIGSRVSAFCSCLVLVLVFAFSRYALKGNYNYICPYAHEMTHGLVLSLAALWFVGRFARRARLPDAALAGLCAGLVFLTKPEIFLAVLPASVAGIALALAAQRQTIVRSLAAAGAYGASLVVAPLTAIVLLSIAMPPAEAAAGVAGGFRWIQSSEITTLPFYRQSMGLLDGAANAKRLLIVATMYALVFGLPAAWGLFGSPARRGGLGPAVACFLIICGGALLFCNLLYTNLISALRPLPLILLAVLGVAVVAWVRGRTTESRLRLVLPAAMTLLSLLLLAKIILYVRVVHYGFVLALPGTIVLIVVLWDWLPQAIARFGGSCFAVRGAFLAVLVLFAGLHVAKTAESFDGLQVRVGSGADAFWADRRGLEVNRILDEISQRAPADASLAGAPEGAMFNYLTRRANSTPYFTLMPVELLMFGEERILAAYRTSPPAYVVLTDESTEEYGSLIFGVGYAERLSQWIRANYYVFGQPPVNNGEPLHAGLFRKRP